MPNEDLLYKLALTHIPLVADVRAKTLVEMFGSAENVFGASLQKLENTEGIGKHVAQSIKSFNEFDLVKKEIEFILKNNIVPIFFTDDNYPTRLKNCYDSPAMLFYKGNSDLNSRKIVSVVGTRKNTEYGRQVCEKLVEGLQQENVLIVSGLAFGIDSIAHRAALKNNLQTIGVVAHGLDRIYPPANTSLANQMLDNGGLLTDFISGTKPDRQNFPRRNRIVAGMCDALVVIESGADGGSIITAELADGYNKDIFAFPGRTIDSKSDGCNKLIQNNTAHLITCADDLLKMMNWKQEEKRKTKQRQLFIELTPQEEIVLNILNEANADGIHLDNMYSLCTLTGSEIAQALLMLEMQGIVASLPGKIYRLQ